MPLPPGTKFGEYEILGPLGAGSMGEVYRARDTRLNRDVAIKVLPELASADPERLQRFEVEAKAAAALNHPNILSVFQMGTHHGTPYLVSELLEGKTLAESVRRPLPLRQVIQYGIQIAHGLAAAHEKGIVHRDLKPENVFVTKDGRVKILDFGLAKLPPSPKIPTTQATTITRLGVAVGTVGYMSPEQVRGQVIDHRTDIFAFGAILCEMVMGQRTFQRATEADTVSAILNEEPPPISQLSPDTPSGLERVIRRCLEKNPEQRFHSASDLAFALEALLDPAWAMSGTHPIPVQPPKHRRLPWIAAAAIIFLIGAFLAYIWLKPSNVAAVNYVQLTHDGQPKSLIGTDGSRLYLATGVGSTASFVLHGIAELSVAGGLPKKIDLTTSGDMVPLGLSPDGSEILLIEGQGAPPKGPLFSVPALGGAPRKIGDFMAETAAWSPDGKLLAYSNLGDLFVANSDGTNGRKVVGISGDIRNITWSPDSSFLWFDSSETAGTVGLQVEREISVDGSGMRLLLPGWHNPPDECCGKWTTDGQSFVFQSQGQIWALPRRAGLFQSAPMPSQLTFSPMTLSSPLPSKDGKKLFVIGHTYHGEMVRYDAKESRFVPLLGGISAEYVDFSKDRKWVTYTSYPEGDLWRSRIDGTERLQLTFPPIAPLLPRWSPDGKTILFFQFAQAANRPARIYEVSPDGGSPRLLLPDDNSQQLDPNWSPDGSKIIFSGESNNPSSSIRIFDISSRSVSTLPGSAGLYSPRWSPDGRYVSAFSADSKTLLLFDFATNRWKEFATGSLSWLNWSHDSRYVYVLDFRQKNAVIRVRVTDGKLEQVADVKDFAATGRYGAALALTPDDEPILLRDTGAQDVYSVDWRSP